MFGRLHTNNRKPQWSRFISCAVLGLYLLTLFAVPMLHTHGCEHEVQTCCSEHSDSVPSHVPIPDSDDSCPVCEFANLIIPFFTVSEPFVWRTDIAGEVYVTISALPVAYAIILPPCRAPPVA